MASRAKNSKASLRLASVEAVLSSRLAWGATVGSAVGAAVALMAQDARAQLYDFGRQSVVANTLERPTISPYLGLANFQGSTALPNYFSYVRPQLQQRQQNIRSEQQLQQLQRSIQSATQQRQIPQQQQQIRPTGQAATYMWYGNFYPRMNVARR